NALSDKNATHTRRPDHSGGMKLDELHVDQLRSCAIAERVTITGVFPAVAGNLVGASDAAGRQYDCLRTKNQEAAALAVVTERTDNSSVLFQQSENRTLHVHIDPPMHTVILQRPNHFQTRAITHMCEPRIFVTTEVALENPTIFGAIEDCAPGFEL